MNRILVIILLTIVTGCSKKSDTPSDYFIDFRPRTSNHLFVSPGLMTENEFNGETYFEFEAYPESGYTNAEQFFIAVHTHNVDLRSIITEAGGSIPVFDPQLYNGKEESVVILESQLESDFQNYIKGGDGDYANLIPIEYRRDGVEILRIYTPDVTLFGLEAGSNLVDHFRIVKFFPDFIATSQTYHLVYGFSQSDKPQNIDEWLNLSPLSPPLIYLAFKTIPFDLPETLTFVVEMITSEGREIGDTTRLVTFK